MSNIIEFLETLGRNARPCHESDAEFADSVQALGLDDAAHQALMARDAASLGELLGGRMQMMCLLFPAEGDENKDDDQSESDQPDDEERKESIGLDSRH